VIDVLAKLAKWENLIWYIRGAMNALINKSQVRKRALWAASHYRPFVNFTRVSDQFVKRIEAKVYGLIDAEVKALPSKGVTIK
jgi:hypothetical protein